MTPNVKSLDVFHFFVVLTSDGTNATEQRLCHTDHNQRSSAMVVSCGFRFQKWLYLMNPFFPSWFSSFLDCRQTRECRNAKWTASKVREKMKKKNYSREAGSRISIVWNKLTDFVVLVFESFKRPHSLMRLQISFDVASPIPPLLFNTSLVRSLYWFMAFDMAKSALQILKEDFQTHPCIL